MHCKQKTIQSFFLVRNKCKIGWKVDQNKRVVAMKFGMRKPSFKKRVAARTKKTASTSGWVEDAERLGMDQKS